MLDEDLAVLYEVHTHRLNEQVKRNSSRFPEDFMFQLTQEERDSLSSQIVSSNKKRGGRRYLPYAFTEHGVAMLSSVLRSEKAILVNIEIMRTFSRIRHYSCVTRRPGAETGGTGTKIRRTIPGGFRRHPPAHVSCRSPQTPDRIWRGRSKIIG